MELCWILFSEDNAFRQNLDIHINHKHNIYNLKELLISFMSLESRIISEFLPEKKRERSVKKKKTLPGVLPTAQQI